MAAGVLAVLASATLVQGSRVPSRCESLTAPRSQYRTRRWESPARSPESPTPRWTLRNVRWSATVCVARRVCRNKVPIRVTGAELPLDITIVPVTGPQPVVITRLERSSERKSAIRSRRSTLRRLRRSRRSPRPTSSRLELEPRRDDRDANRLGRPHADSRRCLDERQQQQPSSGSVRMTSDVSSNSQFTAERNRAGRATSTRTRSRASKS
jgi:hypothetical protein